jgi:hypothetical protein
MIVESINLLCDKTMRIEQDQQEQIDDLKTKVPVELLSINDFVWIASLNIIVCAELMSIRFESWKPNSPRVTSG